ncbi:MAG: hypothetical protein CVV42_13535 [Candidatus Riflebacteria bacterium HGW-Riflebacteria-2]|jgi:PAS domain S-box-containing protein|nr:MAG: hypothetical protein CVV42_13535 [Candidatus Riflebacteria bacterium HGW-Riflebacteria-2]
MGALWSLIFPPIVFFLAGFRNGIFLAGLYIFICVVFVVLAPYQTGTLYLYETEFLKRFFGVYAFAYIIAAGYEYHRKNAEALLLNLLETTNDAQLKVSESEERYRALFEGGGHGVIVADVESKTIVEVNQAAAHMFGYEPHELVGKQVAECHPADYEQAMDSFRDSSRAVRNEISKIICLKKDRSIFYADLNTTLMMLGNRQHVVGFFADVTRLVLAERELVTARKKADAASQAKSIFLANMSHEIRTPIHGIYGMVEIMLHSELSDEQRQYAEIIRDSSNSLLMLINDILDISKIESGKMDIEDSVFDLKSIVRGVFEQMRHSAVIKNLSYKLEMEEALPELVRGDSAKLRQVLVNLLDNAIKFTGEGEVVLKVAPDYASGKTHVRFDVEDSGIGIAQEKQNLLFQSFTQLDSSNTRRFGGSGLGLAISKKLVLLMNGQIFVQSELGKGSHFWFHIPLPLETGSEASEKYYGPARSLSGRMVAIPLPELAQNNYRALLAEDNPVNQYVVKAMLDKLGIPVDVVSNGHEAILALASHRYDILLLDLQMPLLDGFETIKLVRGNTGANFNRSIPAIAVTADAFSETRDACFKAGMNDCLVKPFRMHDLSNIIKKWLPINTEKS